MIAARPDPAAERLEFGIILGDVPDAVTPREHLLRILRQVQTAQEQGFTYICIGQHFLYRSFRWLQPVPLLAHLAALTEPHVRLVPSVLIVPLHHPLVLAEELATLDIVSGGRLIVGVGAGYRREEFEWLGVPFAERYARLEEGVALMQLAWRRATFSHHGRFWRLDEATTHVRPIQHPRPALWFGAMTPRGVRRAARLGDAWIITVETPLSEVPSLLATFDAERRAHARPLTRVPIRREIVLGASLEQALARYEERAGDRFLAYAARGANFLAAGRDRLGEDFRHWARERAIVGPPDDCLEQIQALDSGRLGPIIVRPSWPGMDADAVDHYIREVGRHVVSPIRAARSA